MHMLQKKIAARRATGALLQPRREIGERVVERARTMGITGVPFFIFNQKIAVSGAQDPAALLDAMRQAVAAAG